MIDSGSARHESNVVASTMSLSQTFANPPAELGRAASERLRCMLEQHFAFIYRSLRRLGVHPADLDDASQQVFIIASNNLGRIEPGKDRAFLFGTAMRVAANVRRAQFNRASLQTDSRRAATNQSAPAPDELLEHKQRRELLDHVMNELPTDLRTVFVLYELEGMSSPEIAALLQLPLGTVASRLRRAREQFANEVNRLRGQLTGGEP